MYPGGGVGGGFGVNLLTLGAGPPAPKFFVQISISRHWSSRLGTNAKKRMPGSLADLAQCGWLPLAAALFGTQEWKPQWLHHNFLPVLGLTEKENGQVYIFPDEAGDPALCFLRWLLYGWFTPGLRPKKTVCLPPADAWCNDHCDIPINRGWTI